jgi:DNA-binding CsgD family transcriptional regulator
MNEEKQFTPTEKKVIELLLQGKSNKDIARNLSIEITTVEFHLGNIYTKMNVHSRAEVMAQLGKSMGENIPGESRVVVDTKELYKKDRKQKVPSWLFVLLLITFLIVIGLMISLNAKPWSYEREAEFPDRFTVGQDVDRSNASGAKVHGQFGTIGLEPWSAQSGFATYYNIEIPKDSELYLKLRYSKFSEASVRILVYLDSETDPRNTILPDDQGDWNTFAWTEWIALGKISKGTHSIMFYTDGQEFGIADLDQFILTTEPPE